MWVVKTPQRWDFCGCPGCPLCYDWAEDEGVKISGTEKWKNDLLQGAPATRTQEIQIEAAAEDFHERALVRSVDPGPPLVPTRGEAIELESVRVSVEGWLAERRKEAARPAAPKTLNKVNLDDMGFGESAGAEEVGGEEVLRRINEQIEKRTTIIERQQVFIKEQERLAREASKPVRSGKSQLSELMARQSQSQRDREIQKEAYEFARNYAAKYPDRELPPMTWFEDAVRQKI